MRLLVITGAPATGKSTLMREMLHRLHPADSVINWGLVRGQVHRADKVFVLGDYTDPQAKFSGTDKLAMNVQPQVVNFLISLMAAPEYADWTVWCEGDRLANASFLLAMTEAGMETRLVVLRASEEAKRKRHSARMDTQDPKWVKGRETKVEKLAALYREICVECWHEEAADTVGIATRLLSEELWQKPKQPAAV